MKKLLFVAFAAVALVFAGCSKDNSAEQLDQLKAAIEQQDPAVLQDALTAVGDKVKELVAENPEQAKALFEKVQVLLKSNADKVEALIGDNAALKAGIASFTNAKADDAIELIQQFTEKKEAVEDALNSAKDAVDQAQDAADKAKEAIENAPEAVKGAADQAVQNAKAKAQEKVDAEVQRTKDKANEKIDNAVSDAKKKLGL